MLHVASRLGLTLLTAGALMAAAFAGPATDPGTRAVVADDLRLVLDDKPNNTAKVFRWGLSAWEDEFRPEVGLHKRWRSNHPQRVVQQIGMLVLKAGPDTTVLWAKAGDHARRYGRWETRIRTRVFDRGNDPFQVFFELVPVGDYRCGAKNLAIATYRPGDQMVEGYIRTTPDHEFRFEVDPEATSEEFHTFAVEVTPDHISWFADKKVLMTERRGEALSGTKYKVRFRLVGDPEQTKNESWLQMDWVRYYTLERPNALPIKAPAAEQTTYAGAC